MIDVDWIAAREGALVFWLVVLLGVSLYLPSVRSCLKTMVVLFTTPPILTIVLWVAVAVGAGLLLFEPNDGWIARHFWIALLWFLTIGIGLTFKVGTNDSVDWKKVGTTLLSAFSITAVFDFIVNFRSFSLLAEIILVPIALFAVWCTISRDANEILPSSVKFGNAVLALIGVILIFRSLSAVYTAPSDFFSIGNFRSFYLPFLLCLCVSPVVAITFLVSIYQRILPSVSLTLRNDYLYKYARKAAILRFNINVRALEHWRRIVHQGNTKTVADIDQTISEAINAARVKT